ncbi:osmotically inducible lipoprotein OsmB [Oryzisolibacter propanilivorax]|uniref:Osmotically inducible lipoprotein OsmB n=1 Tax=Oryzisolibacter propanilivorax TaxID=1527607 RepID=A0A1G9R932_9BURK|nr:glycine zipper domain-containing protein [Oryzisolibacter propanilivorax]SDM19651.1 osmotically inducible lipoprotein OsmB [Oryzisolibacter propanilivorax]
MNYRHLLCAAASAAALGLVGCSSNPTNAQVGTGVGAVAGGLVGSAVGGTAATVIGAGAGALVGHEVGEDRDRRQGRR